MDEQEKEAKKAELVAELVRVMGRKPKTPHEAERRTARMAELQAMINTLRHAGDR